MAHPLKPKTLVARRLRQNGTDVEQLLWRALRESLAPWKFRRQHPIGRSIADFACPATKLVIELDGGQHAERMDADSERTLDLAAHGYRVIRFWNNEILENLEGVLMTIRTVLEERTPPLPASPPHRGQRGEEKLKYTPLCPIGAERLGEVGDVTRGDHLNYIPPRHRTPARDSLPRIHAASFRRPLIRSACALS